MYLADTICRAFLNETKEQILPDIEFNSFTYLLVSPEDCEDFQKATQEPRKTSNYKRYRQSSSPVGLIPRTTYQDLDGLLFIGHKVKVPVSL